MATTLSQGDIAIIGYQSDTPDTLVFLLLKDVDATTEIQFTDNGVNAAGQIATGTEGTLTWTSGAAISAGTTITMTDSGGWGASTGTVVETGGFNLTISGDQVLVYQGAIAGAGDTPALLFGAHFNIDAATDPATGWDTVSGTSNTSQLPASLAGFEIAFPGTPERDNGEYTGTTNSGSAADIFAAIIDDANWTRSDSVLAPFSPPVFTVDQSPTVDINTGSTLLEGATDVVTAAELDTNDADTPDTALTYTITTNTVGNGQLWVDADSSGDINGGETALGLGDTFTQQNIVDGLLTYTHNGGETTSDNFGFDVSDGTTGVTGQTFTFTITPVDDPAVAIDDAFTVSETATLTLENVFAANPTTPDSDPDTALAVTAVNGNAGDVNNLITLASGAQLTLNANGTFIYNPNGVFEQTILGATATDSFTYELNNGDTATATVTINGEDNNDLYTGTAGNDVINDAGEGDDTVNGLAGNDILNGGNANDTINGGDGMDTIAGQAGNDTLSGDAGNDTLRGGGGQDTLSGNADNDTLFGGADNDTLNGNTGNDQLFGQAGDDIINTGDGDNVVDGGTGADTITGGIGTNTLRGNDGNDTITGGTGNETLHGQAGDDIINAGDGDDFLTGGGGIDQLSGEAGNDQILGGDGKDTLSGGTGIDTIFAGADADTVNGGDGNDTIDGGAGNDDLSGDNDDDNIKGNDGDDTLNGGAGIDQLFGQAGADTLNGGAGDDILGGGGGTDSFVFDAGWGLDAINDFEDGIETVDMSGAGVSAGNLTVTTLGADAVADFGTGDTITFIGMAGSIDASDFVF